jgi:hypothetical protein
MDAISTRTFEQDGLTFTVKWVLDENPDLSWLGSYQKDASDYCVDRREGVLLGECIEEPEEPDWEDFDDDNAHDRAYDAWDQVYADWENNHGREVLATGLTTDHDRTSYQFFGQFQHLPHNRENWKHVKSWDVKQSVKQQQDNLKRYSIDHDSSSHYDLRKTLDVLYAVLDYERVESYNRGDWCMTRCVVDVTVKGYDVGWGIESDSDTTAKQEVEQDMIAEATSQALEATDSLMDAVIAIEQAREAPCIPALTG